MSFSVSAPTTRTSSELSWSCSRSMGIIFASLTVRGCPLRTEREYTLVVAIADVVEPALPHAGLGVSDEAPRISLHDGPRRHRCLAGLEHDFPGLRKARA